MVCLVPQELLDRPPSLEDGVGADTEGALRIFGVELIQRAGVLLRLPQITLASAAAILQRFYYRKSFADFEVRAVATAALALTCKLEETHRKLSHVIVVFHRLHMRELRDEEGELCYAGKPVPGLDINAKPYADLKREAIRAERSILRELGFEVSMFLDHPHKYVLRFVSALVGDGPSTLARRAWGFLNDSMRHPLCCKFQPHVIAAAGVYLAAQALGLKLPAAPPWWEALDTELEEVRHVAGAILALYRMPRAQHMAVPRKARRKVVEEEEEKAEGADPAGGASPLSDEGEPAEERDQEVEGEHLDEAVVVPNGGTAARESRWSQDVPAMGGSPPPLASEAGAGDCGEEKEKDKGKEKERRKDRDREKEKEKDKEQEKEREREKEKEKAKEKDKEKERDRGKDHDRDRGKKSAAKDRGGKRDAKARRDRRDRRASRSSSRRSRTSSSSARGRRRQAKGGKAKERRPRPSSPSSSSSSASRQKARRKLARPKVDAEDL